MAVVLEQLEARGRARSEDREARWRSTVTAIATGKPLKPETVEQVLDDVGRTREQLRAAVELHTRRSALSKSAAGFVTSRKRNGPARGARVFRRRPLARSGRPDGGVTSGCAN
jgi:hypothetical protein